MTEALLTAEDYARLPDRGMPTELVRGRVVEREPPGQRRREVCVNVAILLKPHIRAEQLGWLVRHGACVRTGHRPDTVRRPDVAFYRHHQPPTCRPPLGALNVVPDLILEVRSSPDSWARMLARVVECLEAGVTIVCVLDQNNEAVIVYRAEERPQTLEGDDELHLPDVLGEFRVAVRRFFE